MISSMTGYGRASALLDGRDITVEIRGVNHRFFEFGCRIPRSLGFLEEKLKAFVGARVQRGKVDLSVMVQSVSVDTVEVQVNEHLAASYLNAMQRLNEKLKLPDDLSLSMIGRFPDVLIPRRMQEDEAQMWTSVQTVAAEALDAFLAMRGREGENLTRDILARMSEIRQTVHAVEERYPEVLSAYNARLSQRLQVLLQDHAVDEARILTEAAIFAEKTDIAEEITRLKSHLGELEGILAGGGQVGRKLDFLVQECNREVNTMGSKNQDIEISRAVVFMKSEFEKIREQIQNIE